jgi:hypothetical protein
MKFAFSLIIALIVIALPLTFDPAIPINLAPDNGTLQEHDCRLWAAISTGLPDSVLLKNLVLYPNSLKIQAYLFNPDGWGIASYLNFGSEPVFRRGARRASEDSLFDQAVLSIDTIGSHIILAHVRHCTQGCCCGGCESIPDPHPFYRHKNGKTWTFAHNGSIPKSVLMNLIGEEYLAQNPPNGSGVPECNPSVPALVTDSELFFLLIMKHIELANWQINDGIISALIELISANNSSSLNFILSDGHVLWAFRKSLTLYSLYDSLNGYTAIASEFTSPSQGNWQSINDYVLIHAQPGLRPESINLRAYMPPVISCHADTSLLYILSRPTCLTGFNVSDPDGNLDTAYSNTGSYNNGKICFNPSPGYNQIVLNAADLYGNQVSCTTIVEATLTDPGQVSGIVSDTNNIPIPNAIISTGDIIDSSDSEGHYIISDLVPGVYEFHFSRAGYTDTSLAGILVTANETAIVDARLRFGCQYVPGDANGSNTYTGLDISYSVNYLKGKGPAPPFICNCPIWGRFYAAADANGNCAFSGLDITYSINYLKGHGPRPHGCLDCPPST